MSSAITAFQGCDASTSPLISRSRDQPSGMSPPKEDVPPPPPRPFPSNPPQDGVLRPEVVVDHVQQHGDAELVRPPHEGLQGVGPPVGVRDREGDAGVVPPRLGSL